MDSKQNKPNNKEEAKERARQHLLQAAQALGLAVDSPEDAWGAVVAVQARIALDAEGGSRSTAAAKLVAQATGVLEASAVEEAAEADGPLQVELDAEGAEKLLRMLEERREEGRS